MGALDTITACQDAPPDLARCGGTLPDAPDCAINYHFGMLLGVDDFRTEQGFHIGRLRRHQRALHGYGVVYGYQVSFKGDELHVGPGYAVDRKGRDLYLDAEQCLGLPAWWKQHKDDDDFADLVNKDDVTFDADILLCYRTCLSRPVPAIADPCAQGNIDIAYSRICESVELRLVPRRDAEAGSRAGKAPYHLLRLLLQLDQPRVDEAGQVVVEDQWLADQLAAVAALTGAGRETAAAKLWQAVLARAAAAETDPTADPPLVPPPDIEGVEDRSDCLVIARLGGVHIFQGAEHVEATVATIDIDQRMTLLPTQVLQSLVDGAAVAAAAPRAGPTVVAGSANIGGNQLSLQFDKPLAAPSVAVAGFAVNEFDAVNGWRSFTLADPPAYADGDRRVTLALDRSPAGTNPVRVTVRGTGPTPILGADLTPVGAVTADGDGADISITISRV